MTVDLTIPSHGSCQWCEGRYADADLSGLLDTRIHWLWEQLAAHADRRGDRDLTSGRVTVVLPIEATYRATVIGLLDVRTPQPGQKVRVDLDALTQKLRTRHQALTPGAVAAHAVGRMLATKAEARAIKESNADRLHRHALAVFAAIPATAAIRPQLAEIWPDLRRSRWPARIAGAFDPEALLNNAAAVIAELPSPGQRRDRRRIADAITGSPHALDAGTLPSFILAVLTAAGAIPPGTRGRAAWSAVGIDCDDLTGGLTVLGIYPAGWILPASAAITLTPRELSRCTWPTPSSGDAWVFVTENPSVATAAADLADTLTAEKPHIRLLCTVGTPSAREIDAIARLSRAGWNIAVRADFDEAGIRHVSAILEGVPGAMPWRMSAHDYLVSLTRPSETVALTDGSRLPLTSWDPELIAAMASRGLAAYEESIMDELLEDLSNGKPQN